MDVRLRQLRLFLFFSSFVWGISFVGVITPWPKAIQMLQQLGAKEIPSDPMLDYWLRMASGAFFLVGWLFLLFALRPRRYANVIPLFGWLMVAEGVILLIHGLRLNLSPLPFYADTAACFLGGIGILNSMKGAFETKSDRERDRNRGFGN